MRSETGDVGRRTADTRARFSTRKLGACVVASAVPAAALLGVPAIAQGTEVTVRYADTCFHAGDIATGALRRPTWMQASTFGSGGCDAGVANVSAAVWSSNVLGYTRVRHVSNPNGYAQTNRQYSYQDGLYDECGNTGAHEHSLKCWSVRSF